MAWTEGWRFESHYGGRRRGTHYVNGGESLVLAFDELDDSRFLRDFELPAGRRFIATVYANGTHAKVQRERGTGATICVFGTWAHSTEFERGTGTFGGVLTLSFKVPESGRVTLGLRLGYWGCEAQGHVGFSRFALREDDDWLVFGAWQVRIEVLIPVLQKEGIDPALVDRLCERMCSAYYAMAHLYGRVPFNGDPVFYETRHGVRAWAIAGNPVVWNAGCCGAFFRELLRQDNACFGTIHEMGHNFDQTCLTAINPEMMANFGLLYTVEKLCLPIVFDGEQTVGRGLQDGFYRRCHEKTIAAGTYHHDGLLWCVMRVKDAVGWRPFEVVMRKRIEANTKKGDRGRAQVFDMWVRMISEEAGRDVSDVFGPGEYDLIMAQGTL